MEYFKLNGEIFKDDRMYLVSVFKCIIKEDKDTMITKIYHDNPPEEYKWCLVTFKNTDRAPATRVDHFDTEKQANSYMEKIKPTTSLVSLNGRFSKRPLPYDQYIQWKKENDLIDYNYMNYCKEGGHNYTESIYQKKEH